MVEQVLDQLDLERERGITIKAQAVRMLYKADDGNTYQINLIDTPGHVDFSYEVSRALAACDGGILVVDASQGIEAQTLANVHQALDHHLKIVPVVNKIDLPQANPELVREEIEKVIGLPAESVIFASARQGIGTKEILEAVVREVPPPTGDPGAPLQALIFDAKFDAYRGVVTYIRVLEGTLRPGMRIQMMQTGNSFEVDEVGIFRPERTPVDDLSAGEVGYLIANIRNVRDSRVGDTVTDEARQAAQRRGDPCRQSRSPAGSGRDRSDQRTDGHGDHRRTQHLRRQHDGAQPGTARAVPQHAVRAGRPGRHHLPDAARRDHPRLLRPAEVAQQGLCLARLRGCRLRGGESRQARCARRRLARRCALHDRGPRQGAATGPAPGGKAQDPHSPAAL